MDRVLQLLAVVGGSAAVSLLVAWLSDLVVSRFAASRPNQAVWELLHRCRVPLSITIFIALMFGASSTMRSVLRSAYKPVWHVLLLVLIASVAWLICRIVMLLVITSYNRYVANATDQARVRRVSTRLGMIRRVTTAAVTVVAIATMLLTFKEVRAVGASLLASAGVIGIVAGVAAQSTLANLVAGLQIAFNDMVRIGDVVVVDGEYGTVEEITLSYLVITTWDERRMVMPVSYFSSKPYENWTRGSTQMLGTVYLQLDHRTPVPALRDEFHRLLEHSGEWDGMSWSLVVTDTSPSTIEVRAMMSARDADDLWTLRCKAREELLGFLVREHPYALPRVATTQADLAPTPNGRTPATAAGTTAADTAATDAEVKVVAEAEAARPVAAPEGVSLERKPR